MKLWDADTSKELAILRRHNGPLALSPDGRILAAVSGEKTVKLWDIAARKGQAIFQGHTEAVMCLAFSPDGKTLASGSHDKTIKLWDIATAKERTTLEGHDPTLASGSGDYTVKLWDVATGKERATLEGYNDGCIDSVAFTPDSGTLAFVSCETIFLSNVESGTKIATIYGDTERVRSVAFTPDGKLLALGGDDHTVRLWEFATVPNGKN